MNQGAKGPQTPAFEECVQRLAKIVEQLEAGDLPLEQSVSLFEDGMRLARAAQTHLDGAEKRVEELLAVTEDGSPETRELTSP